jgi:thiamine kinase-like enzyme
VAEQHLAQQTQIAPGSSAAQRELSIDETLDLLPCLAGQSRTVERLDGGLTNFNYKVTTPQRTVVVRHSSSDGDLLSINRDAEYANSVAAAESGAAPRVLDYVPELHVLVVEFVNAKTLAPQDLRDSGQLARVARACRLLHTGPRFRNDFNMFRIQRDYLNIVRARGFRLPTGYLDLMPQVDRLADALAVRDEGTVPCNNDLLAANFLDDGSRLWLIDYEYSGNNDACFELGNIWSESNLTLEHLEELVDSYYGRHLRHKLARARLLGLMSKYGWTLWASIQDAVSTIDFDFWSWGMEKYDRAVEEFTGPDFERLLDEAQRPD